MDVGLEIALGWELEGVRGNGVGNEEVAYGSVEFERLAVLGLECEDVGHVDLYSVSAELMVIFE